MVPALGLVRDAVDQAADERQGILNGLLDAVRRPGDVGIQLADGALGIGVAVQIDVVDLDVGLHALGVADVVAGGVDRDVLVVTGQVLQQEWARAERCGGAVLDHALGRRGHDVVGAVAGIEFAADQTGDAQRRHDDENQDDRHGVAAEAEAAFGFHGLCGVLQRRLVLKRRGGRIFLGGRRISRRSRWLIRVAGLRRRLGGRTLIARTRPHRGRVLVGRSLRIRHLGDSALSGLANAE